jgi:hypothetical protein
MNLTLSASDHFVHKHCPERDTWEINDSMMRESGARGKKRTHEQIFLILRRRSEFPPLG